MGIKLGIPNNDSKIFGSTHSVKELGLTRTALQVPELIAYFTQTTGAYSLQTWLEAGL